MRLATRPVLLHQGALLALCLLCGLAAGLNPLLAVAAASAAVFVLVVTASLTLGLCLFILVSVADRLPGIAGGDITLAKAVGLLLLLSWLAAITTHPSGPRQIFAEHPATVMFACLWIAWMMLTTAWAEDVQAAWLDVLRYALNLTLLPIVFAAVRRGDHVLAVLSTYVVTAVLCALQAFATGETASDGLTRVSGVAGTANELASLLLTAGVLAGGLALAARGAPIVRALALGACIVCLLGLFATLSRSGLVGLAAVLLASLVVAGRWRLGALVAVVLVGLVTLGYFSFAATDQARDRVSSFGSGTGRTDLWTVGWRMVEDRPLQGVGIGNFRTASIHYLLEPGAILRDDFIVERPQLTHNAYLQVLAEAGILGLIGFLALLAAALSCCHRAARRFRQAGERTLEIYSRSVTLALVGMLVTCFFASDQLNKELWLLLGLGPVLLSLARQGEAASRPTFAS